MKRLAMVRACVFALAELVVFGGMFVMAAAATSQAPAKGQTRDDPVRIGGDVPPLKKIKSVAPSYPEDAAAGTVILELLVSPTGIVEDITVKVPVRGATDAAIAAAKVWVYEPLIWNGEPAWVVMAVSLPNPWPPSPVADLQLE